jgi:protein-disulfide isomerase
VGKSQVNTALSMPISDRDHIRGASNPALTLVKYGDFECTLSGRAFQLIKKLLEKYPDTIQFVFRPYPLRQLHAHAQHAAEAAEAAGAQGKYWEMHDLLYQHQSALEDQDLSEYAKELGLDMQRFSQEMEQHTYAGVVREAYRSGIRSGVVGTPSFFINGRRYEDSWNIASLPEAVEKALSGQ